LTEPLEQVTYCLRHPSVESNLRCSRCNDLICPRCLVQTPVGARCPSCARLRVNPAFDVAGARLLQAASGAIAAAAITWMVYFYIINIAGALAYILWLFAPLGIGYVTSEAAYRSAGYRRNPKLQWVSGGAVVAGFAVGYVVFVIFFTTNLTASDLLQTAGRFTLGILIAAGMAVYRSRV
jgi:hypothetical protein